MPSNYSRVLTECLPTVSKLYSAGVKSPLFVAFYAAEARYAPQQCLAVGWSGYFNSLLGLAGIGLDPRLAAATGQAVTLADGTTAAAIANLPAAGIVVLITVLLVLGTRESARLNNVIVEARAFLGLPQN